MFSKQSTLGTSLKSASTKIWLIGFEAFGFLPACKEGIYIQGRTQEKIYVVSKSERSEQYSRFRIFVFRTRLNA